jgi:hypothetical protein
MINKLIAYSIPELEKRQLLVEAKNLYKSKYISKEQWQEMTKAYVTKLYSPSIFIRILFFIVSLIGLSTLTGPIGLMFNIGGVTDFRILSLIFGVILLIATEWIFIKKNNHFRSGVTEAGIYSGLSFIAFGILADDYNYIIIYPIIGLLLAAFATIRYLNLLALVATLFFIGWIVFQICINLGGTVEALLPFIFMCAFGLLYVGLLKLKRKLDSIIFTDFFIIGKTLCLLVFYAAGNYFVVRELSIELMGIHISEKGDIPFAFVFYILTFLVPIAYLYLGVKQKSILLIRTGLLTIALGVITIKYYYSLGMPMLTITISGAILMVIGLLLFKYLKQTKNGFTADKLLNDKWGSQNLTAFVASQTLGGNQANTEADNELFKGGEFGGGGAGSNW